MRRFQITLLVCASFLLASKLAAQTAAGSFVPVDHWSVRVVDRLQALGLAPPGTVRGQRSRTVAEVRAVLQAAANSGRDGVQGYLERFNQEFGADSSAALLTHASVAAGVGGREGDVAHGVLSTWGPENWTGVQPLKDRTTAAGAGALLVQLGEHFAAGAVASGGPQRSRMDELYGTVRLGQLAVWGGRRVFGFGPGTSGIVLSGNAPFDGGGFFLPQGVRLPGPLRYLGPIRVDVAAGVVPRNGPIAKPYFILTRGSIEPHARFGYAVTRAGMIGEVGDQRVRAVDVLYFFVGGQTAGSEGDNQVVSMDVWYRPPSGSLPMLLYLEWGAEDSAGAWWRVPGIVGGIELPAIPGAQWLSVTLEHADFQRSKLGNPPWYRHIGYWEGWSTRGQLLGHPLGGNGQEWLLQGRGNMMDGRLQLTTRAYTRVRRAENLYAPERAGRSTGALMDADLQLRSGLALQMAAETESGSSWRRTEFSGALRLYFPQVR